MGSNRFSNLWKDSEWREEHKVRLSNHSTRNQLGKIGKDSRRYRQDISIADIEAVVVSRVSTGNRFNLWDVAADLSCNRSLVIARCRESGYAQWTDLLDKCLDTLGYESHKFFTSRTGMWRWLPKVDITELVEFVRDTSCELPEAAVFFASSRTALKKTVLEHGFSSWGEFKKQFCLQQDNLFANHKVVSVEVLSEERDVYDLTLEEFPNFALTSGVFVHNSEDTLQILEAQGIPTKKISTDVNDVVWKNLQELMYEGRISMPKSKILFDELTSLQRMPNGKVDHPGGAGAGKDLADAVGCSAMAAVTFGGAETGEDLENGFYFPLVDAAGGYPDGLVPALADMFLIE